MEDILAIVAVLLLVGAFWFTLSKIIEYRKTKALEEQQERERQLEATRKWREEMNQKMKAPVVKNTSTVPPRGKETTVKYTPSYSPAPTQSVQSNDDGFLTGMLVGAAIDTIMHSSGTGRSILAEERNAEVSKSESSWGFDDSDSRKSISSSMDTSSSWSSSSSDSYSSSSSDSGPSSDW